VVQFSVRGRDFCLLRNVQRGSVSTQLLMQNVARLDAQRSSGRGVKLTTQLYLEPRLRVDLYLRFLHNILWIVRGNFFDTSTLYRFMDSTYGTSRSHSDTPHFVRLLWTSDQPGAECSDNTQHSKEADIHDPGGIRTRIPNKQVAAEPSLRPSGHWALLRGQLYFTYFESLAPILALSYFEHVL
jgi:hypothetical protein